MSFQVVIFISALPELSLVVDENVVVSFPLQIFAWQFLRGKEGVDWGGGVAGGVEECCVFS